MSIVEEIDNYKKERDAVIFAHYYTQPEIQDIADYVGDSFALARLATELECKTIVFCGVRFMGESVKLLSPEKTVLLPEPKADCPMAHMVPTGLIEDCRARYGDDLAVVCYVNSTVEAKALSDVCVTSSNALSIVGELPQRHVLFVPDKHLGSYVGSRLPKKNIITGHGCCPVHDSIDVEEVRELKAAHPNAIVLAHPECNEEVRKVADVIGSTSRLISAAAHAPAREYIVATAVGVEHRMALDADDAWRSFLYPKTLPVCSDMAMVTLEKVRDCLRDMNGEIEIDLALAERARKPLECMLELTKEPGW
ncbi:MAG: quinolinate synthase NadA [Eggerthellaceae bacterium]|nr:quinolinate synthase NadA [Eggerthellaceae bacterium]